MTGAPKTVTVLRLGLGSKVDMGYLLNAPALGFIPIAFYHFARFDSPTVLFVPVATGCCRLTRMASRNTPEFVSEVSHVIPGFPGQFRYGAAMLNWGCFPVARPGRFSIGQGLAILGLKLERLFGYVPRPRSVGGLLMGLDSERRGRRRAASPTARARVPLQ